jgi:hypothetical protein
MEGGKSKGSKVGATKTNGRLSGEQEKGTNGIKSNSYSMDG